MVAMRALWLVLLVCAACTKKPAPKTPAAPPPAVPGESDKDKQPPPRDAPKDGTLQGDPCEGGERK
jgi:hypothetical protein